MDLETSQMLLVDFSIGGFELWGDMSHKCECKGLGFGLNSKLKFYVKYGRATTSTFVKIVVSNKVNYVGR